MNESERYHFEDFTEESYRRIVRRARERWEFEPFGTESTKPHVLWRHDVDYSVHRALALARIEAEEGAHATYFLFLHSELYNLLEPAVLARARELLRLGHWLGLHFDVGFPSVPSAPDELDERIGWERVLLEHMLEQQVSAVSLHNIQVSRSEHVDDDVLAGLPSANGRSLKERYAYISDSNGIWRFRRLPEVVESGEDRRLHVLTHPEMWQAEPMSPRRRIERCIAGRARSALAAYDELLDGYGRENVA